MKKLLAGALAGLLILGTLAACSGQSKSSDPTAGNDDSKPGVEDSEKGNEASEPSDTPPESTGDAIVNIGSTDPIGSMNPLLLDATEINKYAVGMSFMPLTELASDLTFAPMLADSITTEDNLTFRVHIDDRAAWSDGKPIVADDLIFTLLRMGARSIANASAGYVGNIVGYSDDDLLIDDDATEAEGLVAVDEKTVDITLKSQTPLSVFNNTYARYIFVLPKHILGDVPAADLPTHAFFNEPSAVSGPYKLSEFDGQHYASFEANKDFWMGAPKIEKLNIRVVQGSTLVSSLTSGEIDFVQQTFGQIPQLDQPTVEKIEHIKTIYEEPLTNQLLFLNTKVFEDVKVRQAIAHAIDREAIVESFYAGHGEVTEGFLTSYSPFFDETLENRAYDPELAKQLLEEAGWDSTKQLQFNINSGDTTFQQVANVIVQQLSEVGINAQIQMMDLNTLLTHAGENDFDLFAVQYTIAPVDPFPDIDWLVGYGGQNWVGYQTDQMDGLIADIMASTSDDEMKTALQAIDLLVKEDVPFVNTYVIRSMGAANERIKNAEPRSYGSFINIHEWEIAE